MESKEAAKQLKKFFSKEEKVKRSFKYIAKLIGVSHPTLYKKIDNNDFTQLEILVLLLNKIISTNPQPKWNKQKSFRLKSKLT